MDRREFLRSSGAALAGIALSPAVRAVTATPMEFGMSLYGMKSVPLDRLLGECAAIGYRNVEFCLLPGYPTEPARLTPGDRRDLRGRLAAARLGVSGLMLDISLLAGDPEQERNRETIRAAARLAHDLDPRAPPILETVPHGRPEDWESAKERIADNLRSWAAAAAAAEVTLALKAHTGQAVNSPERLLWLIRRAASPALAVAYDYSHYELEGFALEPTVRELLPLTRFIHAKDARRRKGQVEFLLPGQGDIDYGAYFRLLRELDYRGPIVAEVSSQLSSRPGYDPIEAARSSFAVLAAAARQG
jgi:inosose dehydratase